MALAAGEPDCGPWRPTPVADVLAHLLAGRPDDPDRPWVIGVDGRGGSGKSTVARLLAGAADPPTTVVHTDDLAWHLDFFDWADLLAEHVLVPARAGVPVRYTPRAWRERGRPGAIEVPAPCGLLLVEGCGAARRALEPLLDATVWVQTDDDEATRRLLARDGDTPENRAFTADWDRVEVPFMAAEWVWERATAVLRTTRPPPDLLLVGGRAWETGP